MYVSMYCIMLNVFSNMKLKLQMYLKGTSIINKYQEQKRNTTEKHICELLLAKDVFYFLNHMGHLKMNEKIMMSS